ncbi:rho GTPase-activating protein 32-like isoform X1 [Coregonus clupeaformis]|uniref:rho GTPase-activating protein 32-like isoform X1 n=2 Tax=Coregonus clupeaformis TaxID=59861 RepID=UPI001E1C6457|nr:rho GTPase-activating protein 32-like isoform X1 [Coregonus clupeaformis]
MMEAGCGVAAVIGNAASGPQGKPGSGDVLEGAMSPCITPDEDETQPDPHKSTTPTDKSPQESTTAMVRSDEVTELPAEHEPTLRSCVSTASMKVKNVKKLTFPRGHFPRLAECAHFHYETVDFGTVQLSFAEEQTEGQKAGLDSKEPLFLVQICCQSRSWLVKRSYEDFRVLDEHLHLCIYDRRFSKLTELPRFDSLKDTVEEITEMLAAYLSRLTAIADNKINCGPVLTWIEIDNKGNHILVAEESSINVPAIAAAHVIKRYIAQATDELTFEVGDIVSVIDMPPKEDTGWWRGKHGFQVGFFPCDCVELISDRIPPCVSSSVPKPVCKKHGKLVMFLRSFMKSRPPPQKLRQRGILRERVFGCDLGEHLLNSGHDVPQVIKCCTEFIDRHGVVDGMYRLSGISSNIQKLRHEFDSEQIPDLSRDVFNQDIHSVGSLCKLYFRELPNPLLTYQLYERFSEAVSAATDEERLVKIHNVIQQLPPPHYRTLEFLMRHLSQLATFSPITNMHTKNLAIVWAPNLLRSKQIESACYSGTAAFMEVRIQSVVQSVVVEFILNNTEALFSPKVNALIQESTGTSTLSRPKSLLVCSPSTKLLSLEEAQARTQAQLGSPVTTPVLSHSEYIEVGEGPGALMGKFHTVIELPTESKRAPGKVKKSPVGSWRSFFHLGKSSSMTSKRKLKRHPSEPNEIKSIALPGGRGDSGTLRSSKSEESLTSLHNVEGEPQMYHPPRPRSTTFRDDLCDAWIKVDLYNNQAKKVHSGADGPAYDPAGVSPPHQEDDLDLCLPAPGMAFLDFDPMSFQCSPVSPPTAKSAPQRKASVNCRKNVGGSSESEPISSSLYKVVSNSQSPDISPVHRKGGEKKKVSRVVSPKLRRKSSKSPPVVEADVHTVCASAPRCVSDTQGGESSSPPPLDLCEAQLVSEARAPYRPPSPPSFASTVTDSLASQNPPDAGTDRLVNSVSVLPPHPPLTSAARRLALALAESAQKATLTSQRRSTQPPYPLQRQDTPHPLDRPPRPSVLHLQPCSQDYGDLKVSSPAPLLPLAGTPVESPCDRFPGYERKQAPEGQVAMSNFTPTISPLEARALLQGSTEVRDQREGRDRPLGAVRTVHLQTVSSLYGSGGASPPIQSVCSIQSQLAAAVLANTDSVNAYNYRAVLAEASMPGSVDEIPPRPPLPSLVHQYSSDEERAMREAEDVYRHHRVNPAGRVSGHPHPQPDCLPTHQAGPNSMYKPTSNSHYSTLGLLNYPSSSSQYRGQPQPQPREEHSSSGHHRSKGQWQRTEDRAQGCPVIRRAHSFHAQQPIRIQLADTLFYVQRPAVQEKEYQRLVQSDVQPMQPYFENGRVQYRYSPYSDAAPLEESYYYVDPYRTSRIRHSQSYTMRSTRDCGHPGYHYHPSHNIPPPKRQLFLESRDPERVIYKSWDHPEGCDRLVYQPIRQENRARQMPQGPIMSPYENLNPPLPQSDIRGRDISHTRSRSDPGNAWLLAIDRVDSQREVAAVSPISPGQQLSDPSDYIRHQRGHWLGEEPVPPRRESVSRRTQSKQGTSQRHQPQSQHCNVPMLLDVKNVEQGEGGHSRGHDKVIMGNAANSYSARLKPSTPRRPRSQSIREPHYYHHVKSPVEPEHPGSFSTQPHRRTQSTKAMPSHYANLEGYYPAPKPKPSGSGKAMPGPFPGPFPGHGCMPPHSHRPLSQALGGHRAFLQTGLRPEAGVYAE